MFAMRALAVAVVVLLAAGCVTKKEHDRLMTEAAQRLHMTQQHAGQQIGMRDRQIVDIQGEIARLKQEIETRDGQISEKNAKIAALERKLDDITALNRALGKELEKAGKSVDALVTERGSLKEALDDTKARLEELRKAQQAAQKRADLLKNLLLEFKKQIDAGNLTIVVRDGRLTLQLRNDVLFDPGRTDIKKKGKEALRDVARVLATLERELQVAGHTDNVPISTTRFPSNWELSAARAIGVVKFLAAEGVKPGMLSAAGYGEHDPVASNDSSEGRAKNRRIEIVLQPDISELVQVPDIP